MFLLPRAGFLCPGLCPTHRLCVDVAVDGDGLDAEALARAHDAAGNLAAVGHQQLVEELAGRRRREGERERVKVSAAA